MAVRLGDDLDALQARQAPRGGGHGRQHLGEGARRGRHEQRTRVVGQQVQQVVAQHRRARRLNADDRDPRRRKRRKNAQQRRQVLLRPAQLTRRNPRQAAARVRRDDRRETVRLEHVDDRARPRVVQGLAKRVRPHERVRPPAGVARPAQDRGVRHRRGLGAAALAGRVRRGLGTAALAGTGRGIGRCSIGSRSAGRYGIVRRDSWDRTRQQRLLASPRGEGA